MVFPFAISLSGTYILLAREKLLNRACVFSVLSAARAMLMAQRIRE